MLVLRVSRRKEFAATVLVPAIAALLGGLYIDDLAVRGLLPPLLGVRAGVVPRYDLAAAATVAVFACLAVSQWFYGSRTGFRILGAFASSVALEAPLELTYAQRDILGSGGDYVFGAFIVLLPPSCLMAAAVCLATHLLRRLVHGQVVVEWWPGICPRCGYQRRGSMSALCPECGTAWIDDDPD